MVNIFFLDQKLVTCCRYHCDKHVVKMIVESAQILCTVNQQLGHTFEQAPYKMSHAKHPCVLWCLGSLSNWKWLQEFTLSLNDEYKHRYSKDVDHKSAIVARNLIDPLLLDFGLTERPQCMPEKYRVPGDAVVAYRNYYIGEKQYFAKWTKRKPPAWYISGCKMYNQLHPDTPTTPKEKKALDAKLKKEKEKSIKKKKTTLKKNKSLKETNQKQETKKKKNDTVHSIMKTTANSSAKRKLDTSNFNKNSSSKKRKISMIEIE